MKWQWTPYTIPLILAAAFSITAALYLFWRRRHDPVSRLGMLLLLASSAWMLGSALEAASVELPDKIFWDKIQFVGICILPTAWLAHTLRYTGRDRYLTPHTRALLSIVPLTIFLLVITNEAHELIWSDAQLDRSGAFTVKRVTYGVGLWVYIIYSYILVLTGISLLVQTLVRSGQLYRWQGGAILLVVIFVWLVNAMEQLLGLTALSDFELTPVAIGLTAPLVAWIFYRLRLRDIVPVARDAVVESMEDALVVLDTRDHIVDLNKAAQHLFGCTRPEILGQSVAQLWSEWPDWMKHSNDETASSQEVALKQGPEQRTYDMRISPLTDWLGRPVSQVVVLRDITELKRRTAELTTVLEATKAVSSTLDLEKVLALITEEMVKAVGVDGCTLSHWDQEANTVVTWIEWRLNLELTDEPGTCYALEDFPTTRTVLETRLPVSIRVSDPNADPAEVALMRNLGTASLLILPLVIGDRVWGLVELDAGHERDFTAAEIRLCQTLADQAAVAIENAYLHAETEKRLQEQIALREASAVISSTLDTGTVLSRIAEEMGRAVDATSAYISSYDPTTMLAIVLAEYIGPHACAAEQASDLGEAYAEDAEIEWLELMQAGQHDVSHIDDPDLSKFERAHMQQYGAKTILYIPLLIKDQLVGYAELWESRRQREFTVDEIALCHAITQQAAVALENARLYEQAQQEIIERKRAEEQIKASLREKEVLLKEIHHRVKNNLQVISSLLHLQTAQVEDKQVLNLFAESRDRVKSMALIHELLYQSPDLAKVDLAEYVHNLTTYLLRSYQVSLGTITLKLDVQDVAMSIDVAIPCGLIINELVSNALKHAFPGGRQGEVRVGIRANRSRFTLMVRDNGVGLPSDLDFRNVTSLGLQLVLLLVEQLEGNIKLESSEGTAFEITFSPTSDGAGPKKDLSTQEQD